MIEPQLEIALQCHAWKKNLPKSPIGLKRRVLFQPQLRNCYWTRRRTKTATKQTSILAYFLNNFIVFCCVLTPYFDPQTRPNVLVCSVVERFGWELTAQCSRRRSCTVTACVMRMPCAKPKISLAPIRLATTKTLFATITLAVNQDIIVLS